MIVSNLMTTALMTGSPGDLVDQALYEMKLAAIRHLPVVDQRGHLVGIVSDRDVLLSLGISQSQNVYLRDIMTGSVETIGESEELSHALSMMLDKKIGCLPVIGESGQLVGVVTETDFLQVAYSLLTEESDSQDVSLRF